MAAGSPREIVAEKSARHEEKIRQGRILARSRSTVFANPRGRARRDPEPR